MPVIKDTHAGGVTGGIVDSKAPEHPFLTRVARLGSFPSSIIGLITSKVAESRPMTKTLFFFDFEIYIIILVIHQGDECAIVTLRVT